MSAREDVRNEIAEFLSNMGLDQPYGCLYGTITPKNNKRAVMAYTTTFCKPRTVDGKVQVYNTNKIEVTWNNRSEMFDDKYKAMNFIAKTFK